MEGEAARAVEELACLALMASAEVSRTARFCRADSKKASLYPMMFGCWIDARILISFTALNFSRSESFPMTIFFMA